MSKFWKADEDVFEVMRALIAKHFPDLALCDREIAILFREKATKSGGRAVMGAARKASSQIEALSDVEWKFIMEIAWDEWKGLNQNTREALLFHLLSHFKVEEDEETHELKFGIVKPEVVFFERELEVYGAWRTSNDLTSQVLKGL